MVDGERLYPGDMGHVTVTVSRRAGRSDAARHRLLWGLPWSPDTSAEAGRGRGDTGLAAVSSCRPRVSTVQPWPSLSTERAWQSHLGCGQWTAAAVL